MAAYASWISGWPARIGDADLTQGEPDASPSNADDPIQKIRRTAHAHGRACRDAPVHGARAIQDETGRRPFRPVQFLRGALPGSLRGAPVRWRKARQADRRRDRGAGAACAAEECGPPVRSARAIARPRRQSDGPMGLNGRLDRRAFPRSARKRRRWLGGAALTGVLIAGFVAARAPRTAESICRGGPARLAGVWEPDDGKNTATTRRAATRAAFVKTGVASAADAWDRAARMLDRYTADWLRMYVDTCAATQLRGEQSAEVLDLRMDCLRNGSAASKRSRTSSSMPTSP